MNKKILLIGFILTSILGLSIILFFIPHNTTYGAGVPEEEFIKNFIKNYLPILNWFAVNYDKMELPTDYLNDLLSGGFGQFVGSVQIAKDFQIGQAIKNGDTLTLKFRPPEGGPKGRLYVGIGGFINKYNQSFSKEITPEDFARGEVKYVVPDLPTHPTQDKPYVYLKIFVVNELGLEQVISNTLVITPPLLYKYEAPKPKITIIPLTRTQEVRELRPNTTTEIQYAFKVEIPTSTFATPTDILLDALKLGFQVNNQYKWPFKQVKVNVTYPDNQTISASISNPPSYFEVKFTKPPALINGEYKVNLVGLTYSPQDPGYPYTNGNVSFSFTTVRGGKNEVRYYSTGTDTSHTYKIIVPYYPRATINANVGSDEYPALVYENKDNIATLYFTSFTGRFNSIHAGIRWSPTSTMVTRGITQQIEVSQDCGGICPRDYDSLVKKFGSPDKWAIPLVRWDWNKTAQPFLNINMNCRGFIPTIKYDTKSFVFICSNRKAFGNNFGWDRKLILRLNWAMEGNEKLNYEVLNPGVNLTSFGRLLQKSLPATIYRGTR